MPSQSSVYLNPLGKEPHYEPKRQTRSTTEPRPRSIEWQGPPSRSWAASRYWQTGETSSVLSSVTDSLYREPLSSVSEAYPGTQMWEQEGGFWLYSESALLPDLGRTVGFLTGVSTKNRVVRCWAFYNSVIGITWIGPRHTNFPDGSICAYEPKDGTWVFGDSLVELIDLYSVWALRHLHHDVFERWPGPQSVAQPYERLLELADSEHCGCGTSTKRYIDCCKETDLRKNRIAGAIKFGIFSRWTLRCPPATVVQFMLYRNQLPKISELIK